jgi:hypothetical protein
LYEDHLQQLRCTGRWRKTEPVPYKVYRNY